MSAITTGSRFSNPYFSAFINSRPSTDDIVPEKDTRLINTSTIKMPELKNVSWGTKLSQKYPFPTFGMAALSLDDSNWKLPIGIMALFTIAIFYFTKVKNRPKIKTHWKLILASTGAIMVAVALMLKTKKNNVESVLPATATTTGQPHTLAAGKGCSYEALPPGHRQCCLKKIKDNVTIEGTVTMVNDKEKDGDWTYNVRATDGKDYFCEMPCHHQSITILDFKKGVQCITPPGSYWYKPSKWPQKGDKVRVTGTLITDVRSNNKTEIHPVCNVQFL